MYYNKKKIILNHQYALIVTLCQNLESLVCNCIRKIMHRCTAYLATFSIALRLILSF
jgi:hypothetical protein